MSPVYRMVPLRFVVVLCVGVGLPYLTLKSAADALRAAPIPLQLAPMLYLFTIAIGIMFFLGLRGTTRASGKIHSLSGAILGLVPWAVYQLSIAASLQPRFLWMPLLVGLTSGALAGWAVWRGDDGFPGTT